MVDNIWTDFAKSYDQTIPELNCYRRLLTKIARDAEGHRYVIDAGCGTGLVSRLLIERGHTVVGFDNNPGMLGLAYEKQAAASEDARKRWKVMEGDVTHFPSGVPGEADAVVLNNVLFYVREPETVLRQAFTFLKPGGVIIATGPKQRPDILKIFEKSVAEWKAEGRYTEKLQQEMDHHLVCARRLAFDPNEMVTFFQPDALVAALQRVGFTKPLVADGDDYFGESYYVCVAK